MAESVSIWSMRTPKTDSVGRASPSPADLCQAAMSEDQRLKFDYRYQTISNRHSDKFNLWRVIMTNIKIRHSSFINIYYYVYNYYYAKYTQKTGGGTWISIFMILWLRAWDWWCGHCCMTRISWGKCLALTKFWGTAGHEGFGQC